MDSVQLVFGFTKSLFRNQSELATKNLVLRQQLAVFERRS